MRRVTNLVNKYMDVIMLLSVVTALCSTPLIVGCTASDQLRPSGKTVIVPQGALFCQENPGDSVCSE